MKALNKTGRALVTISLLAAYAWAHAATGLTVKPEQESMVMPGMSQSAVQRMLGKPHRNVKYANQPGRTWTYNVVGKNEPKVVFDVDFAADGTVKSSAERIVPATTPGNQ